MCTRAEQSQCVKNLNLLSRSEITTRVARTQQERGAVKTEVMRSDADFNAVMAAGDR